MKKYISLLLTVTLLVSLFTGVIIAATGDSDSKTDETEAAAKQEEAKEETKEETKEASKEEAPAVTGAADAGGSEEGEGSAVSTALVQEYAQRIKGVAPDNTSIEPCFTLIAENDSLQLYAITDNSQKRIGEITIRDKASGYVWRSNPIMQNDDLIGVAAGHAYYRTKSQLALTYASGYNYYDLNSYFSSVESDKVTATVKDGKVKFVYTFNELKFVIPVEYSLDKDGFKAEILINDKDAVFSYSEMGTVSAGLGSTVQQQIDYNISEIRLLPAFGATSFNENGYMFIPDGSGAIINYNNGKTNTTQPYIQPVYGRYKESKSDDYNVNASDRYLLPVFGTVKADGHALMGIIEDNAAVAYVGAEVGGYETAYNKVYSSYLHKIIKGADKEGEAQPMSTELRDQEKNYSVKYYCLNDSEASYVGMAKRYRQYLIEEKGMKKSDDMREGALYLDMYAGVEKKTSIAGIPWNIFDVMTTYEDLRNISDDMTEFGIDNVVFKYNDWTKKSNRTKVQNKPNFESAIGGKSGFVKTAKYLEGKGMGFYPNIDFVNFSKSGNGFSRFSDSVKFTSQAPAYQSSGLTAHINMGSRWCLLKADCVKEAALSFASKCAKYDIKGVSIENIGNTPYSDGSHGGLTRGDCVNTWQEIFAEYKNKGINVLTTEPNAYALIDSDILMETPSKNTYVEIADEAVPFYQIVVHGYKSYTTEVINMSSNPDEMILNAVETGSSLLYSLVAGDTTTLKETYLKYLYSCNYSQWKDSIVENYKKYSAVIKLVEGSDIVNHEKLAQGVYKTTYANGVGVYVNYNDSDAVTEKGTTIPAVGYITERGE